VYYCTLVPPHPGETLAGEKRWHRVEVTKKQCCASFVDRSTGETFNDRWQRWRDSNG
jgi:hypothetical protein